MIGRFPAVNSSLIREIPKLPIGKDSSQTQPRFNFTNGAQRPLFLGGGKKISEVNPSFSAQVLPAPAPAVTNFRRVDPDSVPKKSDEEGSLAAVSGISDFA